MKVLLFLILLMVGTLAAQEPMGPCKPGEEARTFVATKYAHLKNPVRDSGSDYKCEAGFWQWFSSWSTGFSGASDAVGNPIPLEYSEPQECADGYRQRKRRYDYRHLGAKVFYSYSCVPKEGGDGDSTPNR